METGSTGDIKISFIRQSGKAYRLFGMIRKYAAWRMYVLKILSIIA